MWDLLGNPEDRFSHNEAQIAVINARLTYYLNFTKVNMFKKIIELDLKSIRPFSGTGWGIVLPIFLTLLFMEKPMNDSFKLKNNV